MLNKIFKHTFVALSFTLLTVSFPVSAEENHNEEIAFSVQKIAPVGEVHPASPFYDLKVKPGDKKVLEAKILNSGNGEIQVDGQIFATYTNKNGEIAYTSQAEEYDPSLQYKMNDLAKIYASDIKSKVSSKSQKIVRVEINVPKEAKDGVILGSWYFEQASEKNAQEKEEKSISIGNKYSYALPIKLTVNKEIDQPSLTLESITTGLSNYKKAFFANVVNDQPAVLSKLSITAQVMKKGKYDVLYQNKTEGMIMAPNSGFGYPVYLGKGTFQAGDYTMKVTATTADNKWARKTWTWSMDFTILNEEAKELNSEAINDPEPEKAINWWLLALLVLCFALIGTLFFLLLKRKKQEGK
ncbi:MAG: DUF916 and DUF3324 domain-containing protein [Lactobacillales bacterium]|jgi:hypothetical protein|nr:DUF916 and DUF3324 domain-containing protein [Lactobacillales bacterium]